MMSPGQGEVAAATTKANHDDRGVFVFANEVRVCFCDINIIITGMPKIGKVLLCRV